MIKSIAVAATALVALAVAAPAHAGIGHQIPTPPCGTGIFYGTPGCTPLVPFAVHPHHRVVGPVAPR